MFCLSVAAADVAFTRRVIDSRFYGDCKAWGDLHGDSLPDVAIDRNQLAWYRYPAWSQTVIAKANLEITTDLPAGDVGGDGALDITVPDSNSGNNLI